MESLADIFDEMAELYTALGDRYRSSAYDVAAARIRQWLKNGAKKPRPKLAGGNITKKISEWERTGRVAELADLRRRAAAVAKFAKILGVGPAKSRELADEYNSLAELRRAMSKNEVSLTPQQRLGVRYYDDLNRRHGRDVASAIAKTIMDVLRGCGVKQVEVAGSYRRGLDTVGDLDIIFVAGAGRSLAPSLKNIHDALACSAGYIATVNAGTSRLTLLWAGAVRGSAAIMQVDLLAVPAAEYAPALLYFTGSKEFNVCLRGLAKSKGYRLNQMGLFKNGKPIKAATESAIFAALGLPYIPPAERTRLAVT